MKQKDCLKEFEEWSDKLKKADALLKEIYEDMNKFYEHK